MHRPRCPYAVDFSIAVMIAAHDGGHDNPAHRNLEDDPARPRYILTEQSIGYRFAAE
jgi:hypothetical protein